MSEAIKSQSQTDISNLRFYAAMASDFKWQTDVIHHGVIAQTLNEIADRLVVRELHELAPALFGDKLLEEARDAAIEYINLYCEAADIEDHNCTEEDFARCEVCDQTKAFDQRANILQQSWVQSWAVGILRAFDLLAELKKMLAEHQRVEPHHHHLCADCQSAEAVISKTTGGAQ